MTDDARNQSRAIQQQHYCNDCEYFDRHWGDCLSHHSDRFQTKLDSPACSAFYLDTTKVQS